MTRKMTIYLPDDLKAALERAAALRGQSEAEVVRQAIVASVERPRPIAALFHAEPFAAVDEVLPGFGER